jgi:hypothetical protein
MEHDGLRPHDPVEFIGPSGPVLQWPKAGERGAVESVGDGVVRVVWERSPLEVAWPKEWIKRCYSEPAGRLLP